MRELREYSASDYQARTNMKNGIKSEIDNGRYNTFITLATNNECHVEFVKKMIRHWNNDINARVFRYKRFHNDRGEGTKYDDCFRYIGLLEVNALGHNHYHLVAYVHPDKQEHFEKVAGRIWKKKIKSGTIDIQKINRNSEKLASYVTKEFDNISSYDHYITS